MAGNTGCDILSPAFRLEGLPGPRSARGAPGPALRARPRRRVHGLPPCARPTRDCCPCTRRDAVHSDSAGSRQGFLPIRPRAVRIHRSRHDRWEGHRDADAGVVRTRRSLDHLASLLHARRELLEAGETERSVAASVRGGQRHLVRRGWYVDAAEHADLFAEDRHLLHALAVARDVRGDGVVSHESAAVLHGLDLYRHEPTRVHMTTAPGRRISSVPDVFRHCADIPAADVVELHGIRCTSLARTVFDLARTLDPAPALVVADGAERRVAGPLADRDDDAVAAWRAEMTSRVDRASGARGIRRARWVTGFADGLAETTLESVSRLRLHQLGFRAVRLQVAVAAPGGREYRLDFGIDEAGAWGECDGTGKYLDAAQRSGRTAEQVLLDEKRREDWIRGTTGRRVLRWEDRDVTSTAALGRRLSAFGVRPPR